MFRSSLRHRLPLACAVTAFLLAAAALAGEPVETLTIDLPEPTDPAYLGVPLIVDDFGVQTGELLTPAFTPPGGRLVAARVVFTGEYLAGYWNCNPLGVPYSPTCSMPLRLRATIDPGGEHATTACADLPVQSVYVPLDAVVALGPADPADPGNWGGLEAGSGALRIDVESPDASDTSCNYLYMGCWYWGAGLHLDAVRLELDFATGVPAVDPSWGRIKSLYR